MPLFGNRNALQENKFMGNLHQDAGSVAGFVIGPFGAAVHHVFEYLETVFDNVVGLIPLDIDNQSDAARVAFVIGIV